MWKYIWAARAAWAYRLR